MVPVLDTGSKIIRESAEICDYLDQTYPNPPLYHEDQAQNEKDKSLIEEYGRSLIPLYYDAAFMRKGERTLAEYLSDMMPSLHKFEEELEARGPFFGGDKPKMIDYMLWPWAERAEVLEHVHKIKLPVSEDILPFIYRWCKEMRNLDEIRKTITSPERLYKITLFHFPGAVIDYDSV